MSKTPHRRRLFLSGLLVSAVYLAACGDKQPVAKSDDEGEQVHPVATTFSAVHSWTAVLLTGIEEPVLIEPSESARAEMADRVPSNSALRTARGLVGFGGPVDESCRAAYRKHASTKDPVIILAQPERTRRQFDWLVPTNASAASSRLAGELMALYPAEHDAIQENLATLQTDFKALDSRIAAILEPHRGTAVSSDDNRVEPLLDHYGLRLAATLVQEADKSVTQDDLDQFEKDVRENNCTVLILTSSSLSADLAGQIAPLGLRSVWIDPILDGNMGPNHYAHELESDARLLHLALLAGPLTSSAEEE